MKTYIVHGHIKRRDGKSEAFWTRTGLSKSAANKLAREQRAEAGGVARVVAENASARSTTHARKKTPTQLDREIAAALAPRRGRSSHSTKQGADATLFAVEIDRKEFDTSRGLPAGARWREDLVHLAEEELGRGRTYRRPKDARYAVIEWTSYRGEVGKLLDWMEAAPGITRYGEIFE